MKLPPTSPRPDLRAPTWASPSTHPALPLSLYQHITVEMQVIRLHDTLQLEGQRLQTKREQYLLPESGAARPRGCVLSRFSVFA